MSNEQLSLLKLVPEILRAREFRLYTKAGRLVDLWQNNGAAVLGHTPPSLLRTLKNTASRGLYAPFPHFLEARYHKALSCIFPDRTFRLYAAPPPGLDKLAAEGSAALWRPFADPASPFGVPESLPVLIPVVPGIQTWRDGLPLGLCVLAVKDEAALGGDILPPVLLAAAVRGIYDLISAAHGRANPQYPRIAKALKSSHQNFWQRGGIYLTPKQEPSQTEWAALFRRFLENGFLLPPHPSHPLILPGVLSPGEEAKLALLL
ncbi:MAG: hypothetical protein LBC52_01070 [Treponema sp.]|jgi:hypothetical protein|nr:hypothetical protein [Treponema sp.]